MKDIEEKSNLSDDEDDDVPRKLLTFSSTDYSRDGTDSCSMWTLYRSEFAFLLLSGFGYLFDYSGLISK